LTRAPALPDQAERPQKGIMRTPKLWNILILLIALTMPAAGYAGSGGFKSWFHSHLGNSSGPQHQNIHPVVKHYVPSHPKPLRVKNVRPRKIKREKPA
jgi:hypothetical protein